MICDSYSYLTETEREMAMGLLEMRLAMTCQESQSAMEILPLYGWPLGMLFSYCFLFQRYMEF